MMTHTPDPMHAPTHPRHVRRDAVSSPEIDDALERSCRRISRDSINRSGIERLRVLSHSKLQALLVDLVEQKLKERLASTAEPAPRARPRAGPDPILRKRCLTLWRAFRAVQAERLRGLHARVEALRGAIDGIESSIRRIPAAAPGHGASAGSAAGSRS